MSAKPNDPCPGVHDDERDQGGWVPRYVADGFHFEAGYFTLDTKHLGQLLMEAGFDYTHDGISYVGEVWLGPSNRLVILEWERDQTPNNVIATKIQVDSILDAMPSWGEMVGTPDDLPDDDPVGMQRAVEAPFATWRKTESGWEPLSKLDQRTLQRKLLKLWAQGGIREILPDLVDAEERDGHAWDDGGCTCGWYHCRICNVKDRARPPQEFEDVPHIGFNDYSECG